MRISRTITAGLAVAAATTVMAAAAQAAEVKLKAASFLPERVVFAKYFYQWTREINKQCAGKVKIGTVGPAAIKSLEQWHALKNGVLDMHYGPANYYRGVMPGADVFTLAHNTPADQRKNGAWAVINELHNKKLNAWYLTALTSGVKFYVFTLKPTKGNRFDGFRLRSVPLYDGFFKSLGAQTIRLAAPSVYTALERGVVDGYGWPSWGIGGFGWQKFTKYRYGPGFFNTAVPVLINLDKWRSMTGDQRQCLTDMAIWMEKEWPKLYAEEHAKQMSVLKKADIKYVDLGPDFARKAEDTYWAEMEKGNPEYARKMRPLLQK